MGFTFILFVYVAFAYCTVCSRSSKLFNSLKSSEDTSSSAHEANKVVQMQKRITRLVVTDFVCWVPICVLAFSSFAGVPIPPWLYSFTIVILLPVNSALNPVLYSDVIASFLNHIRFRFDCYKKHANSDKLLQSSITNRSAAELTNPRCQRSIFLKASSLIAEESKELHNESLPARFRKFLFNTRSAGLRKKRRHSRDCLKTNAVSFSEDTFFVSAGPSNIRMESNV